MPSSTQFFAHVAASGQRVALMGRCCTRRTAAGGAEGAREGICHERGAARRIRPRSCRVAGSWGCSSGMAPICWAAEGARKARRVRRWWACRVSGGGDWEVGSVEGFVGLDTLLRVTLEPRALNMYSRCSNCQCPGRCGPVLVVMPRSSRAGGTSCPRITAAFPARALGRQIAIRN